MKKTALFIVGILGTLQSLVATPPFGPYWNQLVRIDNIDANGNYESRIWLEEDNSHLIFHTESLAYEWQVLASRELEVLESWAIYGDQNYMDLAKMERFELNRVNQEEFRCSRVNEKGRERILESTMENALDITMVKFILYQEYTQNQGPLALEPELFDPARLRPYRMSLVPTPIRINELQAHQRDFTFPETWEERLEQDQDVILVEGNLLGIPGAVYPYDFNYLLDSDYRVIMEWGGAPGKEYFALFHYEELNL